MRTQVWLDNESDPDFPPEWIAAPYVYPDASVLFIKSYFKAYARLFKRSLGIGVFYWFLVFCFGYDILIVLQLSGGGFVVPMLVICILMALQSMMVSLVLAVEYPKAKYVQLLKNGFLLSVRRIPVLLLTLVALGGYAWALFTWTIPVLVFASGIAATWYGLVLIGRQVCCSRPWQWRAATSALSTCTMRRVTAPRRRVLGSEAPRIHLLTLPNIIFHQRLQRGNTMSNNEFNADHSVDIHLTQEAVHNAAKSFMALPIRDSACRRATPRQVFLWITKRIIQSVLEIDRDTVRRSTSDDEYRQGRNGQ